MQREQIFASSFRFDLTVELLELSALRSARFSCPSSAACPSLRSDDSTYVRRRCRTLLVLLYIAIRLRSLLIACPYGMFADTNFAELCPDVKVAEYCLAPPADGVCCG